MPTPTTTPRPSTPEEWEALFLDPDSTARVAARTDADIADELECSRQAISKRRADLGIEACPVLVEIETPPDGATLREIAGWRIRLHRVRHGWTSSRLAKELGGSWIRSAVACVELARVGPGRRTLAVETLQRFADRLQVSPADLLLRPGQTKVVIPPRSFSATRHLRAVDRPAPALLKQFLEAWARKGPDEHRKLTAAAERAAEDWEALGKLKTAPLMRITGVNVIRWRCARGLSQTELEGLVSGREDHSRISDVERLSRRAMALELLEAFADALGCTPADLVRLPRQPALVPVETG